VAEKGQRVREALRRWFKGKEGLELGVTWVSQGKDYPNSANVIARVDGVIDLGEVRP